MVPATAFQLLSSCKFSSGKKVLENAFKNNIWAKPLTQLEPKEWEPEDSRAYTDNNIHERLLLDARICDNIRELVLYFWNPLSRVALPDVVLASECWVKYSPLLTPSPSLLD